MNVSSRPTERKGQRYPPGLNESRKLDFGNTPNGENERNKKPAENDEYVLK
jgi:hypothetical protein